MALFERSGGNILQPLALRTQGETLIPSVLTFSSEQGGRNFIRNAQGIPYVVDINATGKIEVWKGNAPEATTWVLLDSANAPDEAGSGGSYRGLSAASDSTGVIHISYFRTISLATQLRYVKFENDLYAGDGVLVTGSGPHSASQYHTSRIAVDANDKVHIAFNDTRLSSSIHYSTVRYINNVTGSWSSPLTLSTIQNTHWGVHDFIINNNNLPVVTTRRNASGDDELYAFRGDANNPTAFNSSGVIVSNIADANSPRIGSTCTDSAGNIYHAYLTGGSTSEIALLKNNTGDAWTTWANVGQFPVYANIFQLVPVGLDLYLFWREETGSIRIPGIRYSLYSNGAFGRGRTIIHKTTFSGLRVSWANYAHRAKDGNIYANGSPNLPNFSIRALDAGVGTRVLTLDITSVALGGELRAGGAALRGANLTSPLSTTYNIFAAQGGAQATPLLAVTMQADPAVYTLTGEDATLTKVGGGAFEMAADAGSYTLQGQAATFLRGHVITADAGSYALQGQDADLIGVKTITADAGSYALQGQAVTFTVGRAITADAATYTLQGQDADLLKGSLLAADAGSYALQGQAATFSQGYAVDAEAGTYNFEGESAALFANLTQCLRPTNDTDNTGAWFVTPLWSKINDAVGTGDGTQIESPSNPGTQQPFTVKVTSSVSDPQTDQNHIIRVRAAKASTGGANYDIIVQVRQDYVSESVGQSGTLIASFTSLLTTTTPTTFAYTLSGAEADAITNYPNLYLRIFSVKNGGGGNRAVNVFDVEFCVPPGVGNQFEIAADPGSYLLTGEDATLTRTIPPLDADAGSYLLTGDDATFARSFVLHADAGTYTLQGQDVDLIEAEIIEAEAGSYILTGEDADFDKGLILNAAAGAYILTGQDADLIEERSINAGAGSYILTGQDVTLSRDYILVAESGNYILTGEDADFDRGLVLDAAAGAYILTGQDADLISTKSINAEAGAYILTGEDADFDRGLVLSAEAGAYVLQGQDADLIEERTINAEAGAYVLTGQDADLIEERIINAEAGTYVLTGEDVDLISTKSIEAEAGAYILTGEDANLIEERTINAEAGAYNFEGEDADLIEERTINAEAGTYNFEGEAAEFSGTRILSAEEATYNFEGEDAGLLFSTFVDAEAGDYDFEGEDVTILRDHILAAEAGQYDFDGMPAFLAKDLFIAAEAGTYTLQGEDADLRFFRIDAEAGAYNFEGEDAVLLFAGLMEADPGQYDLDGEDIDISVERAINAQPGVFILKGEAACLEWLRRGRYEKYECFTLPFIGVRGACENLEPTSGMWVNSLPGVTLKRLSKLANEGDLTATRFFRRLEKAALDRLLSDVTSGLAEEYQINSSLDTLVLSLGDTYDSKKAIRRNTRIWKQPDDFMSMRIETISLKADDDVTTTVYIDDGFQDIAEYVIELKAGKTGTLRVDFETVEDYVDIYFDSACANWARIDTCLDSEYLSVEHEADCGDGLKGAKGVIGLKVSAVCDSCNLLGSHLDALALPALYMTGILIMQEVINSDRINPYVRNSKKEARKMLFHWYGGLDEQLLLSKKTGEYHKVLAGAIRQIKNHVRRIDSDCVSC